MYAGINYPDYFTGIVAFSTVDYISEFIKPVEFKFEHYPSFYMGAGRYEESIFRDHAAFVTKMKEKGVEVSFREFVAGHDSYIWQTEWLDYLMKRMGG